MAIGTSLGQWFPDRFSHVTQKYQSNDNNVMNPDLDPDRQTNDQNELSPKHMMGNMQSTPDPNNKIEVAGKIPFPDNHNPDMDFANRFPSDIKSGDVTAEDLMRSGLKMRNVEDRTNQSFVDTLKDYVGQQFTQQKLNDVLAHPFMSTTNRAMAVNSDEYYKNMTAADTAMSLSPQEKDLYQRHLDNLNGFGGVNNANGSRSTLFAATMGSEDKTYVVPTVHDGQILSGQQLRDKINEIGIDKFPSYSSQGEADQRYDQMHSFMEKDTAEWFARKADLSRLD